MDEKDKEVSAVQKFLGEVGSEGEKNPFQENSEDPFAKQSVEPKEVVVEKEEKLPFNKDPKITKYLEKREKEIENRIISSLQNKGTKTSDEAQKSDYEEAINAFTTVIGNDTPEKVNALSALKRAFEGVDQRATQKAMEKLEAIKQAEIEADKKAEEELESGFESIEEAYGVDILSNAPIAKKTRQEFVAYIERIAPKDLHGNIVAYPDMNASWEEFQEKKKATAQPSRAKELASRSMARSSEAVAVKDTKGLSFDNIIEHLTNQ